MFRGLILVLLSFLSLKMFISKLHHTGFKKLTSSHKRWNPITENYIKSFVTDIIHKFLHLHLCIFFFPINQIPRDTLSNKLTNLMKITSKWMNFSLIQTFRARYVSNDNLCKVWWSRVNVLSTKFLKPFLSSQCQKAALSLDNPGLKPRLRVNRAYAFWSIFWKAWSCWRGIQSKVQARKCRSKYFSVVLTSSWDFLFGVLNLN